VGYFSNDNGFISCS